MTKEGALRMGETTLNTKNWELQLHQILNQDSQYRHIWFLGISFASRSLFRLIRHQQGSLRAHPLTSVCTRKLMSQTRSHKTPITYWEEVLYSTTHMFWICLCHWEVSGENFGEDHHCRCVLLGFCLNPNGLKFRLSGGRSPPSRAKLLLDSTLLLASFQLVDRCLADQSLIFFPMICGSQPDFSWCSLQVCSDCCVSTRPRLHHPSFRHCGWEPDVYFLSKS